MINMIEKQVNDADYTAMDIAAAFLKMYLGQNENVQEEEIDNSSDSDFDNTGAEEGMVRLFINIGKSQKVKAKDILGYSPKVSFDDGLERTHDWFCENWENIQKSAEF